LLVILYTGSVLAQFDTATVLGTVRDKSGGIIPGAKVTLTNLETGIKTEKLTDENGSFEFFTVRTGRYRVSAEMSGFSTAVADNVTVNVNAASE
jgi:hypothetical protein